MFGQTSAREEKGEKGEIAAEDRVHLKPLWGIRPGVYLAALYALILLGVLFFLLAFQGLTRPGSLVVISSEPSGAAVRIDGVTLGAAPCKLFIPRGKREIELVLPGFTPLRLERDIPGPLLGAPLFPHREYIAGTLRAEDPLEPLILAAAEFAAWSFTGEPTAAYQVPLVLSEGAYRAGAAGADSPNPLELHREFDRVLRGALRFTVTRAGLRDLLRAKFLIDNGGCAPSPLSLVRSLGEIAAFLGAEGSFLEAGGATGPSLGAIGPFLETGGAIGPFLEALIRRGGATGPSLEAGAGGIGPSLETGPPLPSLGGLQFREIPGGTLIRENALPRRVALAGFRIADAEVSPTAWAAFLAENPEWRPENAPALQERGLVSSDYLVPQDQSASSVSARSGLSWYAARAYCEWLTRQLPPSLAAWEVRLPTEAEWEYAAKQGEAGGGPPDMLGGLWEWCEEPFAPLPFFPVDEDLARRISSPERPVKGGSWASAPLPVGIETRASLPPASCSAFVGFRPVIARRGTP